MSARVVAGLVALLALAGVTAVAATGEKDPPASSKQPRAADESGNVARAERPEGVPEPVDPRRFPRGVTVVGGAKPVPPKGGTTLPPGLTPLVPRREDPSAPRVRIHREQAPAEAAQQALAPDFDPPGAPFVGPRLPPGQGRDGRIIGPTEFEQEEAFGRPPQSAGAPLPPRASWAPREGFPPPPDNPAGYPRPPARWIEPAIDPTWVPTPSWPAGQDLRDWSPSHWIEPAIDPTWTPQDAWDRKLGIDEVATGEPGPIGEASRPAEAGEPGQAGQPDEAAKDRSGGGS